MTTADTETQRMNAEYEQRVLGNVKSHAESAIREIDYSGINGQLYKDLVEPLRAVIKTANGKQADLDKAIQRLQRQAAKADKREAVIQ